MKYIAFEIMVGFLTLTAVIAIVGIIEEILSGVSLDFFINCTFLLVVLALTLFTSWAIGKFIIEVLL